MFVCGTEGLQLKVRHASAMVKIQNHHGNKSTGMSVRGYEF